MVQTECITQTVHPTDSIHINAVNLPNDLVNTVFKICSIMIKIQQRKMSQNETNYEQSNEFSDDELLGIKIIGNNG